MQGAIKHQDSYACFATAIVILEDPIFGHFHTETSVLPVKLKAEDDIFIDPVCNHEISCAERQNDRLMVKTVR